MTTITFKAQETQEESLTFPYSLVAQTVKRLPARRETRVRFLGREDPLEMKSKCLINKYLLSLVEPRRL